MKPIPIKSAKEISKEFEVPEVVIFGYDPQTGKQHVTTYGKTIDQCKDAARAGNYLKKALGWPAELCNAEPSRAKKQQDELTRLRAEVERLRGDGWISVKERLPEKNAEVTIYTPHGGVDTRVLGICDDDPNGLWYCYKGVDEPLRFNEVTHWRPLPEPPRGE